MWCVLLSNWQGKRIRKSWIFLLIFFSEQQSSTTSHVDVRAYMHWFVFMEYWWRLLFIFSLILIQIIEHVENEILITYVGGENSIWCCKGRAGERTSEGRFLQGERLKYISTYIYIERENEEEKEKEWVMDKGREQENRRERERIDIYSFHLLQFYVKTITF